MARSILVLLSAVLLFFGLLGTVSGTSGDAAYKIVTPSALGVAYGAL